MSSADPRVIMLALQDLIAELQRWSVTASEVISQVGYRQRQLIETVEIALHRAGVVLDRAQQDEERVEDIEQRTNDLVTQCTQGVSKAEAGKSASFQVLQSAQATLQHWQEELAKAKAWLARAKARLEAARVALRQAQADLRNAEWELNRAINQLRAAQNDKERRSTWGEQAAVNAARARVAQAQTNVTIAQAEVIAAEEEVARAEARVALCEQAVQMSENAVEIGKKGFQEAETALNYAERSREAAQATQRTAQRARQEVDQEYQAATQMMSRTRQAQEFSDEGRVHLSHGENQESKAQMDVSLGRREVEEKIDILREINRPTLQFSGFSGGGFSSSGGSGSASNSRGKPAGFGGASGSRDAVRFVDKNGRSITLVQHPNGGESIMLRAYDTSRSAAPETPGLGVGRANLQWEKESGKLKLQDIEVNDRYRGNGIASRLLSQVEQAGRQSGASEIYGVIEGDSARSFWQAQSQRGWQIVEDGSYYGRAVFHP